MNGYPTLPTATTVALEKFRSAGRHDGQALPAKFLRRADGTPLVVIDGLACPYANEALARDALQAMVRRGAIYMQEGASC